MLEKYPPLCPSHYFFLQHPIPSLKEKMTFPFPYYRVNIAQNLFVLFNISGNDGKDVNEIELLYPIKYI